jgi:hypothetical protein
MAEKIDDGAKLIGTLKLYNIQKQVMEGVFLVLEERMREYHALGLKYKPTETTVVNEIMKRGIESILKTDKPVPLWKPSIYRVQREPKGFQDTIQRLTKKSRLELPDANMVTRAEDLSDDSPQ